jgi:TatD DNase family protein
MIIDTHCHLDMPQFDPDREDVIKRAKEAGLEAVITIGSDIESSKKAIELARKHDLIYAAIGIHPHDAKRFGGNSCQELKELARHEKVVAIGETGLDYHYDHSPRENQREVMKEHLALARELELPVIVHSREAQADTLRLLRESGNNKGVLHCFSGDMDMADAAMGMGFYISIAGPVTFKKSTVLRDIAVKIPDDYLLIETDAPYLSPEPMRGKRNEPSYIVNTARELGALRGVSPEDIARITTLNAKRLFGIGALPVRGSIAYAIRESLYLNITNRCTNACSFCVRFYSNFVKGHMLRLEKEPRTEELLLSIGDPKKYKEIVFCGYGEPLIRLDTVKEVAAEIKKRGGRVRVNTNGHGNLIHERNILPELAGLVDSMSISLDAPDAAAYERLCRPVYQGSFKAVLDFIREAKKYIPHVQCTVVEQEGVDLKKCEEIARGLGVPLRVRKLDVVG